jgi:Uma2 family endonuclease
MALILNVARAIDDAELRRLSQLNPGHQLERDAQGRLVVTPTGWRSGGRNMQLAKQLLDWHAAANIGKLFDSSTGFHLPDGSVRSPDASWVSDEQWRSFRESDDVFPPLCPDVIFELRSTSDSMEQLRAKLRAYAANGCKLGVLVDPEAKSVELYRPNAPAERHDYGPLSLAELPGFTLDPGALD